MAARDNHELAAVHVTSCSSEFSVCGKCLLQYVQSTTLPFTSGLQGNSCGVFADALSPTQLHLFRSCTESCFDFSLGEEFPAKITEEARPEELAEDSETKSLYEFFTCKGRDAIQALGSTFKEVVAKATALSQELVHCKKRLRKAEEALEEQSANLERLETDRVTSVADKDAVTRIFETVDTVGRENERLKSKNEFQKKRIKALKKQLIDQQSVSHQIDQLSAEIVSLRNSQAAECERVAAEQVSLEEILHKNAQTIAEKVADVIPLVAHLKIDSDWMNSATAESLFQLVSLGISGTLSSVDMRLVARVSLLLAQIVGPSESMTAFSNCILELITKNPERGVNLLRNIETVYLRAKGEADFKEVIKGIMELAEAREDSLNISARLSKFLSSGSLCEFVTAMLRYSSIGDQAAQTWKEALLGLPSDWADSQLAERCLGSLMIALTKSSFSEEHLALVKLLCLGHSIDETAILTFAARAGVLLNSITLKHQLHAYILDAISQIEFGRGKQGAEGQMFCRLVCTFLNVIGENDTVEGILKSSLLFKEMFQQLRRSSEFQRTAENIEELLQKLAKTELSAIIESCMIDMLILGQPLHQVVQVNLFLTSAHQETGALVRSWKVLLDTSRDKRGVIDAMIALMKAELNESLFFSLQSFERMASIDLPTALDFFNESLSVLRDFPLERQRLTELLRTVVRILGAASESSPLVGKCVASWKIGRARGPSAVYPFCQYVLERLNSSSTEQMLDNAIATFSQKNSPFEVVSTLLEIHVADSSSPPTLSRQLAALRSVREAESLSPLLQKLRTRSMQPQHRALFICAVLDQCATGELQTVCSAMDKLIDVPEVTSLLTVLSHLQEPEIVKDFVEAAGRNNAVAVTIQLASVFVEFEAQEIREVRLPADVKQALLQRPGEVSGLLPSVTALLQNRRKEMATLCLKVLGELGDRNTEAVTVLMFVCDLARGLIETTEPSVVVALCNVILVAARDEAQIGVVWDFQRSLLQLKERLIILLQRVRDRVTLQDIDGLLPKPGQLKELVNVQSKLIRFFDFDRKEWGQPVQLKKEIQYANTQSAYTILDDGTLFCCGGTW